MIQELIEKDDNMIENKQVIESPLDSPNLKKRNNRRAFSSIFWYLWDMKMSRIGLIIFLAYVVLAIVGPFISPYSPTSTKFMLNSPPTISHPLGTTAYGQDVMSQILSGAAPTLLVALFVGFVATLISVLVGIVAGLSQSTWIDAILNGITYIFLLIPGILFIILIATFFLGAGISLGYVSIILALTLTGWAWGARTLRAQTMSIAKLDYILSSKLIGESKLSIVFRQIIPGNFSLILSNLFFTSIYGILGLTFVEFFGLGNEAAVNWGTILYWSISNEAYLTGEWWWYIPISFIITGLGLSFAMMNFGMDQVSNAKLRNLVKYTRVVKANKKNRIEMGKRE
ncbi:MAG: ABC transporter permease [Thermoplasmatales archaeon]